MALLRNSERSVTGICLDVGFTSLGTFCRTFHALTGASPTSYRWRAMPKPYRPCFCEGLDPAAWMSGRFSSFL